MNATIIKVRNYNYKKISNEQCVQVLMICGFQAIFSNRKPCAKIPVLSLSTFTGTFSESTIAKIDDSALKTLSSLRGLRGAPEVPPLCRDSKCWNLVAKTQRWAKIG